MVDHEYNYDEFDTLFNPKHIAFIGASEKSVFGSMMFLTRFKDSEWADTLYPVNPNREKVLGWKCYPSVLDIPYPVDTAYISVKTKIIPLVIKECVEKNIKWVITFASGFSETGDPEGKILEEEVKKYIRGSNTRIIGPNCLGPFNASSGMSFSFASLKGTPGGVSFMSQSGGHLTQLVDIGFKRDIRYRYGVSFGNQIDLNCVDFLRHFKHDPNTKLVAAYLESFGSGNGKEFFLELREATKIKPVVLWKGGHTSDGSRAAFSHTGAIASDGRLWRAMAQQTGATLVEDNEQFWNAIKTLELLYPKFLPKGKNVGIITPGGGSSVNMTDLFACQGLKIPLLTPSSQEEIQALLPKENVNIGNPIDLGATGFLIDVFIKCMQILVKDPNIDILIVPLWPDQVNKFVFRRMISRVQKMTSKPFAFCLPSLADSGPLALRFEKAKRVLHKERVLYYLSLRDAAHCISLLCNYSDFLKSHKIKTTE